MKTALTADFWPSSHLQIIFRGYRRTAAQRPDCRSQMISSSTLHEVSSDSGKDIESHELYLGECSFGQVLLQKRRDVEER